MTAVEPPRRTSFLAGLAFLCGLGALACVTTAWFLTHLISVGELGGMVDSDRSNVLLAARIVAWATIAPAVFSLAFTLGAKAMIGEAGGVVGGRSLYRVGLSISALSVVLALAGHASIRGRAESFLKDVKERISSFDAELKRRQAKRGFLGVNVRSLSDEEAAALGVKGGACVESVMEGSAAAEAGLRAGDIVLKIDGDDVASSSDFVKLVSNRAPGSKVIVEFRREGRTLSREATLRSRYPEYLESEPSPAVPVPPPTPVPAPSEDPVRSRPAPAPPPEREEH